MSKFMRTLLAVLGIGALMLALVAVKPASTSAANLTGGNYTYVVDGEEMSFSFDPISRTGGLLLPMEVFQQFGVTADGASGKLVTLTNGQVTVKLTLGNTQAVVDGVNRTEPTAPLRLNGRVFVPGELLKEFGVEYSTEGNYVIMRRYVDDFPTISTISDSDWTQLKANRGLSQISVRSDSGAYLSADMIVMTKDMINSTNVSASYGVRAKLNSLLDTNTLIYVKLTNPASKAGGLVTTGLYLIGNDKKQYEIQQVVDTGDGLLSAKLAPSCERAGILVFPKVPDTLNTLQLFSDSTASFLGTFPQFK